MKKVNKVALGLTLALTLSACSSSKVDPTNVMSMNNQNVNINEIFQQSKTDSKGEGFFDLIDKQLLEEKYSLEKNKKVKEAVEKQEKEILEANPDILSQYDVKTIEELAEKAGLVLSAQRDEYVKDEFNKKYVTDQTLKKLYDQREGETVSYTVVELDESLFDNNEDKLKEAVKKIQEKLKAANKDNVKEVFEGLVKEYPGDKESITNGVKENVSRDDVNDKVLAQLDKMAYLDFTKDPITESEEGKYFFIYKSSKNERLSFDASKERLKDEQYKQATQDNPYLKDYILMQLRENGKVSFANGTDQKTYTVAMNEIKRNYEEAQKGDE